MAKVISHKTNFHIVVRPSEVFLYGQGQEARAQIERDYIAICEEIARDIERHADNVGSVHVMYDEVAVCEHCGSDWTETDDSYNGGCCAKDEESARTQDASHE